VPTTGSSCPVATPASRRLRCFGRARPTFFSAAIMTSGSKFDLAPRSPLGRPHQLRRGHGIQARALIFCRVNARRPRVPSDRARAAFTSALSERPFARALRAPTELQRYTDRLDLRKPIHAQPSTATSVAPLSSRATGATIDPYERFMLPTGRPKGADMRSLNRVGAQWDAAYDPAEFAAKHGLTLKQATVVIESNGPSKEKCDQAALVFARALQQFGRNRPRGKGPGAGGASSWQATD
jgi:hypothetical protein